MRTIKRYWLGGLALCALLAAACGPSAPAPSKPAAPAASAAPTVPAKPAAATGTGTSAGGAAATGSTASAPATAGERRIAPSGDAVLPPNPAEWDRLKEAARREGKIVVAGPGFPTLRNAIVESFQRAHGITVEYLGLPSGEVITRIDREARAGTPTVDINIGGSSTCWALAERGLIDNSLELVVDPAVVDPSKWRTGGVRLVMPSPDLPKDFYCAVQTAEWVMTDLFVNSQQVPPASITSWRDLLKPEYRGKIAAFDPRRPGPGQTPLGYLHALFGEDYLRDLYVTQQPTFTADNRQLAEWVARGTHPIGIALVQAAIEPLRAEGLPLERVFPTDGPGSLTGGFSTVMRIKGGPNPNAAAVFLNWFASREAQEMWEREMLETSLRTDVPHSVPDYVIPKPGVEYPINDYHPDYYFAKRAPAITKIQELLGR
jgi:ABC-type Fe3+ transport system substrate-binding protein